MNQENTPSITPGQLMTLVSIMDKSIPWNVLKKKTAQDLIDGDMLILLEKLWEGVLLKQGPTLLEFKLSPVTENGTISRICENLTKSLPDYAKKEHAERILSKLKVPTQAYSVHILDFGFEVPFNIARDKMKKEGFVGGDLVDLGILLDQYGKILEYSCMLELPGDFYEEGGRWNNSYHVGKRICTTLETNESKGRYYLVRKLYSQKRMKLPG